MNTGTLTCTKQTDSAFSVSSRTGSQFALSHILSTFLGERANDLILLSDDATWEWILNTPNYPAETAEPQSRQCPALNP